MVGYDNLIFGRQVPTSGGSDGILAGDKRLNPHGVKAKSIGGGAKDVNGHAPVSSSESL